MKDRGYYSEKLSAERLRRCYTIAPPRVQQYLNAEVDHVRSFSSLAEQVLELGCGYGRVIRRLAGRGKQVFGIDTSLDSLLLAKTELAGIRGCFLMQMDAVATGFRDRAFDLVLCIQNGISAFNVDCSQLIAESVRIVRPGGYVLLSSYAERFWDARLDWFHRQADADLLGEIDTEATGDGVIVCKDGFRAGTLARGDFERLTRTLGLNARIREVDESSLFCEISVG